MKRLWLLCAPAGFLLSSATPPPVFLDRPVIEPEAVLDAYPMCADGQDCTELADSAGDEAQLLQPEPLLQTSDAELSAPTAPTIPRIRAIPDDGDDMAAPAPERRDPLRILISIPLQKAYVFDEGELVATSPVSTGKRGHETPVGTFRILQKKVHHRSNKYANAPMPYMQRLTSYGIALHAGHLPGYPASHGCIRLPRQFAKKLYGLTDMGTRVTITRQRPKSAEEAMTLA